MPPVLQTDAGMSPADGLRPRSCAPPADGLRAAYLDLALAASRCEHVGYGQAEASELHDHVPDPAEAALASGMHTLRRRDFLLGRLAAMRAIEKLGAPPRPITQLGRAPHFGDDLRGSISHSRGLAVAIALPASEVLGVGVDVELGRLSIRAAGRLLAPAERRWVAKASDPLEARLRSTLLFSIKESVFKALSPSFAKLPTLRSIVVECARTAGPLRAHATLPASGATLRVSLDVGWNASRKAIITCAIHHSDRSEPICARPAPLAILPVVDERNIHA